MEVWLSGPLLFINTITAQFGRHDLQKLTFLATIRTCRDKAPSHHPNTLSVGCFDTPVSGMTYKILYCGPLQELSTLRPKLVQTAAVSWLHSHVLPSTKLHGRAHFILSTEQTCKMGIFNQGGNQATRVR